MATNENLPPNVIRQLAKELKNLDQSPPEGIRVIVNDDDFTSICADIEGPGGTPYENGIFRMKLVLCGDFPRSPPKGYFVTKIFHPNISSNGEICVNTLKKDWNPTHGLRHVLLVVRCLLIEPFPESALNEQAGKMLLENYEDYARHARLYTSIHAIKPKSKPKSGTISESTTAVNVDQSSTNLREIAPSAPTALCATATTTKLPGSNSQDQNAPAEPAVGTSAALPKSKPKSGTISESTTAVNVDQSSTNLREIAPSAPTALCATATTTKLPGSNSQDQNAPAEPAVGTSAALPKSKPKSGTISESTTAVNVDQSSTNLREIAPSAPTALCATATTTKLPGSNSQDQNAPAEPAVGTSAALPKKEGHLATKAPVDKKKVDARKKSKQNAW